MGHKTVPMGFTQRKEMVADGPKAGASLPPCWLTTRDPCAAGGTQPLWLGGDWGHKTGRLGRTPGAGGKVLPKQDRMRGDS